jgi:hypothetical protein
LRRTGVGAGGRGSLVDAREGASRIGPVELRDGVSRVRCTAKRRPEKPRDMGRSAASAAAFEIT